MVLVVAWATGNGTGARAPGSHKIFKREVVLSMQ